MATNFGMADGRMTNQLSSRIYNDQIQGSDPKAFRSKAYTDGTNLLEDPFKHFAKSPQPWMVQGYEYPQLRRQPRSSYNEGCN
jgi:hypothetical protein